MHLPEPFEEHDGSGMGYVHACRRACHRDVDGSVAAEQYVCVDAVDFIAYYEGCLFIQSGGIDVLARLCGFNCDDFVVLRDML